MRNLDFIELFGKRPQTIKLDLERMQAAYQQLGEPAAAIPVILVAGTNGKGTTAAFLWQLLSQAGYKTGLYTSPHLLHVSERVQITGIATSDEDIHAHWQALRAALPVALYDALTFFEVITLIALLRFAQCGTDINVIEVGLGGRLDATNILDPLVSVVTAIGRDHQEYLGEDIADIAREKAAIGRRGRPLFWGDADNTSPEARAADVAITAFAEQHSIPLYRVGADSILPGVLQTAPVFLRRNFALAATVFYEVIHRIGSTQSPSSPPTLARETIARFPDRNLPWPAGVAGRFQPVRLLTPDAQPAMQLLLDAAHNPDGARALKDALYNSGYGRDGRRLPALISILADKDFAPMLDVLQGILDPVVLFRINHERSWQQRQLGQTHQQLPFFGDFATAWRFATTTWRHQPQPWIICGSILALAEVMAYFAIQPGSASFGEPLFGCLPTVE